MVTRIRPTGPVAHFLRAWRIARGLTQEELAARLDTNKSVISLWENGRRGMSAEVLTALAEVLDITVPDIFRHPDEATVDLSPAEVDLVTNLRKLTETDRAWLEATLAQIAQRGHGQDD